MKRNAACAVTAAKGLSCLFHYPTLRVMFVKQCELFYFLKQQSINTQASQRELQHISL